MTALDPIAVAAWVRATTAAQGLPEKVTDMTVLADVAVMLATGHGAERAHGAPAPRTHRPAPRGLRHASPGPVVPDRTRADLAG
ncbi:hypothetical protein Cph01nite_22550 [Cellulomonas phragmiteti]|uniref:Uncharacterized protein n=1 Tax=Cellulomonas phragmiteti TaxID=478780 RepID=A0ABQ4DMB9_9CELL|nr:hypothetical protein Cph01nite_22550 [Cellulomonas phragmiteti]